jgi:predicted site-specific integrase-resolvase
MPLSRKQEAILGAKGYLPIALVAEKAGVTRATVDLWIKGGEVKSLQVGRRKYVERASLVKYLGTDAANQLEI